jgi:signal transduction histidine kinase
MNSLRARMTVSVTVAFAVWMLLLCLGLLAYTRHMDARQVDNVLNATERTLRHDITPPRKADEQEHAAGPFADPAALGAVIENHREDLVANHVAALLLTAQGHVLQQSQSHIPPWPLPRNGDWKTRTIAVGSSTLVLGYDWGNIADELRERAITLLALSLCVVAAAAFGAWILVGRTLSPIGRLAQQATTSSAETLHLQLTAPSPDAEIVELVTTLNGLLARLGETAAAKGRFYAAASHELRTPLQALSGHLEVALSRPRPADAYRTTLEEAHTQTRRLTVLVRDLLLLNQLDTATTPPECETVCIAEICDRALRHCQPLIEQHGLRLQTALEQDGEMPAPPAHAEMLLRNLIENAVKFASPGGDVRVALSETPSAITVMIFNSCAPMENWHAEALFEPFFRLDASRNAKTGGNGLGLAICKAIVLSNRWQIALDHDDHGVRATVGFPRHSDETHP